MSHYIGPLSFYLLGMMSLLIFAAIIVFFRSKKIPQPRLYKVIDFMKYGIVCLFTISASLIMTNLWKEKQLDKQKKLYVVSETMAPISKARATAKR